MDLIDNLYWVGPRTSDILGAESLFKGAIVLTDTPSSLSSISYESKSGLRINTNDSSSREIMQSFYHETAKNILKENPAARFLWYAFRAYDEESLRQASVAYNTQLLVEQLSNKLQSRAIFATVTNTLSCVDIDIQEWTFSQVQDIVGETVFVAQKKFSSGGYYTHIIKNKNEFALLEGRYLVSAFIHKV